jgi:hypothetical protein
LIYRSLEVKNYGLLWEVPKIMPYLYEVVKRTPFFIGKTGKRKRVLLAMILNKLNLSRRVLTLRIIPGVVIGLAFIAIFTQCEFSRASQQPDMRATGAKDSLPVVEQEIPVPPFDSVEYLRLIHQLSRNKSETPWPAEVIYPKAGALLPFNRIVAFYGNLYSTRMGILGALPPDEMLKKLKDEIISWQKADTSIQAIPALHYIAVTAQQEPGKGKKYRLRMPGKEIDKVLEMARGIDAIVFLDIQVGHSTLQEEIPELKEYLKMPHVHLGIDPEYSMKGGEVPGRKVGTMDAEDINYAAEYLADLVREYNLPPKVLVVHRFKKMMVTNYQQIKLLPEVQVVMNMDGFGSRGIKLTTYKQSVTSEPVQFAGFKVFYKNDAQDPAAPTVMRPDEILKIHPVPVYIQYQ